MRQQKVGRGRWTSALQGLLFRVRDSPVKLSGSLGDGRPSLSVLEG